MEKIIWVIGNNRKEMIEAQRKINSTGSMRALCILSFEALEKLIAEGRKETPRAIPSLIILDYDMLQTEDERSLEYIKEQQELSGVLLFFMMSERNSELDEICYSKGAVVVMHKPFSKAGILRVERMAWQHEVTKQYEQMLQKQAADLQSAREIMHLNQQLEARNTFLHQIFGRYFSDKVLEMILENPEGATIGGERKCVTVMMADLRGFTSISEELEPESMRDLLNVYFSKMTLAINEFHGTVIEFLGDAILAVFGAPLNNDKHASDAVAAAITMQNYMKEVNAYCVSKGYPTLEMGIGVHTGEAFIGNVGSETMMRYNVLGNVVNECSCIESVSVGGQVLISENTVLHADCPIEIDRQLYVTVKGIKRPIPVCVVAAIKGEYSCRIQQDSIDILKELGAGWEVHLYPVEGKVVKNKDIISSAAFISKKNMIVSVGEVKDSDVNIYSDYEVSIVKDEKVVFSNIYAKATGINDKNIILRFTHIYHDFQIFIEEYVGMEENMKQNNDNFLFVSGNECFLKSGGFYRYQKESFGIFEYEGTVQEEDTNAYLNFMKENALEFLLMIGKEREEYRVFFYSSSKRIRAIEFLDYLISEYGLINGSADIANGRVSATILQVQMSSLDVDNVMDYFLDRVVSYFETCEIINACDYLEKNHNVLASMRQYVKKKVVWAFVRTIDVAEAGTEIKLKSLENESGFSVIANEDTYIMIGNRGEVYDIQMDKFERTYEETPKPLDIIGQMLEYLPEVELLPDGEYVALDEIAKLCYPKSGNGIYCKELECRTKVFPVNGNDEYYLGNQGDYLAVRLDDSTDLYIIQKEIFGNTYEEK